MDVASYLIFRLSDAVYALPARAVVEVLHLPELSRLNEVPNYVVGIANLRGQAVPVIDLNVRFARERKPYGINQCLVIISKQGPPIGVIADCAESVRTIAADDIVSASSYGLNPVETGSELIEGVARLEEEIVMLLHLEHLLKLSQRLEEQYDPSAISSMQAFFHALSAEEVAIFKERSSRFSRPLESEELIGGTSLALVRIGEELFGIELISIREFAHVRQVTPVPCCPEHIVGQMNLRGEIITLLDVAGTLGLQLSVYPARSKVVVMDSAPFVGGVLVDEFLDVFYLKNTDISPAPTAGKSDDRGYLRGVAIHESRPFSFIDMSALLANGCLDVNEKP